MTCELSKIRQQLDDLQKLMEAQAEHNSKDRQELINECPKEAIKLIIEETLQACRDKIMKLPARGDMRRMALQAIDEVK